MHLLTPPPCCHYENTKCPREIRQVETEKEVLKRPKEKNEQKHQKSLHPLDKGWEHPPSLLIERFCAELRLLRERCRMREEMGDRNELEIDCRVLLVGESMRSVYLGYYAKLMWV